MRKITILILSLLAAGAAAGQSRLPLEECLKQGMEANYGVKIARNRQSIAANNVTYAPFLPALTAGARANSERNSLTQAFDTKADVKQDYSANLYNVDVSLGWRLFDGMAMFATHNASKELLKAGQLNLKGNMEQLAVDIASQYYYIVTQQSRLEAAKLYLEISTLRYNQALEKYVIGSISGLEMKQAKIDFNADSSRLVQQQQTIQNAYIQLFEMMNSDLESAAQLCDSIIPDGTLNLGDLRQSTMEHNTSILLARSGQRVSQLDLRIARSSLYPTLDLTASYRFNHSANGSVEARFSEYYGPTVGVTLSMKLFDRLETRRKIRNANLMVDNSDLEYDRTCSEVVSSLQQLYNTYRKNITMIGFEMESADAALANLQAAMEMYRLGSMSGVEFREIQRSYLEAEDRKLAALYNAKISEIGLLYLSGRILM